MRIAYILIFCLTFCCFGFSQNHVSWTFEYDHTTKKVMCYGRIDEHWHVYSDRTNKNAGPIPVSFTFTKNSDAKQKGKPEESGIPIKLFDPNFEAEVFLFENIYIVEVPFKVKKPTVIKGFVNYMACDDKMCLPPIDVPFSIDAKP